MSRIRERTTSMFDRIIWAYIGSLGLPLVYIPFGYLNQLKGENFFYTLFFMSPLGMLIAMADHDSRLQVGNRNKFFRSILTALLLCLCLGALIVATDIYPTEFMLNKSWILIPTLCPLIVAPLSNIAFRREK